MRKQICAKQQTIPPYISYLSPDFQYQHLPQQDQYMKYLSLIIVFQLFAGLLLQAQDSLSQAPPNVILIVVDDMGWNDVSYHGSEIQTPTLDRLAREGVELNRFYVHSACTPTRSSLLTGKTALRLGVINPIGKNNVRGLPLSEKIMPQYFKDKGYATHLVGKWHLGRYQKEYWPYNRGFDHFYGYLTGGIGHYNHVHGGSLDWQRDGQTIVEEGYSTHLLTDEAIKILQSQTDQPLFLELCYAAPHMPNEAPHESVVAYNHIKDSNRQLHAAMVSEVDKGIQKLIETLEATGQLSNSIIWFMSDNGGLNLEAAPKDVSEPLMQFADVWGTPLPFPFWEFLRDSYVNSAADNSPLRGGKGTVYEGGLRVPSFIYAPQLAPAQKVDHRITVNDVLPTLVVAVGLENFDTIEVDGMSQWAYLQKQEDALAKPYVTVAKSQQAYFKGDWKLILNEEGEVQLYQVDTDSTETMDLASQYPDMVKELKAELLAFPRGEPIDDPLWKVFIDPDKFGGEIDREPFAGLEGRVSGPIHSSLYIAGLLILGVLGLVIWGLLKLRKVFFKKA
ncbi:MAG: arylsulfatase [Bacteroidota bacterium]